MRVPWTIPPADACDPSPTPRPEQAARAHVVDNGYKCAPETIDGGCDVPGRNGWAILSLPPATSTGERRHDSLDSRRSVAILGAIGFSGLVLV